MQCPACGAANPPGHRFCGQCGSGLGRRCAACGAEAGATDRFCGLCGASLQAAARVAAETSNGGPQTERRIVSVLFADLVGFTALSEQRDTEDVRALLGRYFETARAVVERYGGVVEKFIGDAVMALWGAPTAREDDAERAVRAALDLCDAVSGFGAEVGAPELRLRAGVATGEAAVTVGAQGQGMVAGDTVNTASRIQAAAPAGGVLVEDRTWRATEAAIAYEQAEEHVLKGKSQPVRLRRATRVTGRVGGALRGAALEAPFVGREHELRLVKTLFDATVADSRARLVAVSGPAGIGKSRLGWELEKYLDGIATTVLWHRGRCLPYGEGVAYWALVEMVRSRAGITEMEDARSAREKLRAAVEPIAADPDEARWVERRLGQLLDVDTSPTTERNDLFAAWRLFFERLARTAPVALVFEEMQWADAGLVDFVAYLMEWSRHQPIFVMTLARPEFNERHPSFAVHLRSVHALYLEPLSDAAMDDLLCGIAPGLPDDVRRRIAVQAEGVPLYAVETVRMLLDQGLLVRQDDTVKVVKNVGNVDVPTSLHALIAARLDCLDDRERALVRDASVLGRSFSVDRLATLMALPEPELRRLLDGLVRREILIVDQDPRSPCTGQYAFSQALVQRVAYDTLSRRDRKARHLAVARNLEEIVGDGDEVVEVVAAHYLEAIAAAPEDGDVEDLRRSARDMLLRAGERAMAVAASENAHRHFLRAADLAAPGEERAEVRYRAGEAASAAGRVEEARAALELALAETAAPALRASVTALLGYIDWTQGRGDAAVRRLEEAFAGLAEHGLQEQVARVGAQLARFAWLMDDEDRAGQVLEMVLEIAERRELAQVLSSALNTKGMLLTGAARPQEGTALLRHALRIAESEGLIAEEMRAHNNLSVLAARRGDLTAAEEHLRAVIAGARRLGDRGAEHFATGNLANGLVARGQWDEAMRCADEAPSVDVEASLLGAGMIAGVRMDVLLQRGDIEGAARAIAVLPEGPSADPQYAIGHHSMLARLALAQGDVERARKLAFRVLEDVRRTVDPVDVGSAVVVAVATSLELGDRDRAREVLDGARRQFDVAAPGLRGHLDLATALVAAAARDAPAATAAFAAAADAFRSTGQRPMVADTLIRQAGWLADCGRADEALEALAEADAVASELGGLALLERSAALRAGLSDRRQPTAVRAP